MISFYGNSLLNFYNKYTSRWLRIHIRVYFFLYLVDVSGFLYIIRSWQFITYILIIDRRLSKVYGSDGLNEVSYLDETMTIGVRYTNTEFLVYWFCFKLHILFGIKIIPCFWVGNIYNFLIPVPFEKKNKNKTVFLLLTCVLPPRFRYRFAVLA